MATDNRHELYPVSLALGFAILLNYFNFLDIVPDKLAAFMLGILFMHLSWLIVYYTFLRKE